MNSIKFIGERLQATRDAQVTLAAGTPSWVWAHKTVLQWSTDITLLEQLKADEILKRVQWRNAAGFWDAGLRQIQQITRDVKQEGSYAFRAQTVHKARFEKLRADGTSRDAIYNQGDKARGAWQEADPAWTYTEDIDLGNYGSLLAGALALKTAHGPAETAWRSAAAKLMNKARAVDADSVAWYAAATRKFPAGTVEGDMLRSTVPTTSRPESPVGQAVISNVMVSGTDIHFDCAAPHATRFTYLHQTPGASGFVVVVAETPEASLTLHGQIAGLHKFKALGRNSRGTGPESAVAEVTVAAENVG